MAHPIASLPLRGLSAPLSSSLLERAISAFVSARVQHAASDLSRYDAVARLYGRNTRRKSIPVHPTLGWFLSAQLSVWKTVDELAQHSERTLEDIQIPREAIRAIAVLSAFGWPREEASASAKAPGLLASLRRRFFPNEAELEEAYLSQASDIHDLEYRMSEWDRRRGAQPVGALRGR
jgi:hypothetical protein